MTNEQKAMAQWRLDWEQHELHCIEAGEWPAWAQRPERTEPPDLDTRRRYAEWCLKDALRALIPTLPKPLRVAVQACVDARERIWSEEYLTHYYERRDQAKQKASPESLATEG
jgi:hypothetical protein